LACLITLQVKAVENVEIDGIKYVLNGSDCAFVTSQGENCNGEIEIPSSISHGNKSYEVRICQGAFVGTSITSIVIPQNTTWVEEIPESGNGGLASNSFEWGGTSSDPNWPNKSELLDKFNGSRDFYRTEFDDCVSLKAIYMTNTDGEIVNKSGAVIFTGNWDYKPTSRDPYTMDCFIYLPKGFVGTLYLSGYDDLYFCPSFLGEREYLKKIFFPNHMDYESGMYKDCPNIESFEVFPNDKGSSFWSYEGALIKNIFKMAIHEGDSFIESSNLVAFPPAQRDAFDCNFHIDEHAFDYCQIDHLKFHGGKYQKLMHSSTLKGI